MKRYWLIVWLVLWLHNVSEAYGKDGCLEARLTFHEGLGNGAGQYTMNHLRFVDLDNYHWKELLPPVKGIPSQWKDVRMGIEYLDMNQFFFQNVKAGKLPTDYLMHLPDTTVYSDKPIRCFLFFAEGTNPDGKKQMVVDQNNNQDFSDDPVFYTDSLNAGDQQRTAVPIIYDIYAFNQIEPIQATLFIRSNPDQGMYFTRLAQYASFEVDGQRFEIAPIGSNYISYTDYEVSPAPESKSEAAPSYRPGFRKGEYIQTSKGLYGLGVVDRNKQVLRLKPDSRQPSEIPALQIGFQLPSFSGSEFTTGQALSSEGFRGNYLLVNGWSPGCGSCITELPHVKALYEALQPLGVGLLGLTLHSDSAMLTEVKQTHEISWPLLLVGENSEADEAYRRTGTPVFFLVDPQGVILSKSYRAEEVREKMKATAKGFE